MPIAFLGLGANLGDKLKNLNNAIQLIHIRIGNVMVVSSFYPSKAQGFESNHLFLNAVIKIETNLSPLELLLGTQTIEREFGRTEKSNGTYTDRPMDIDILMYDQLQISTPKLTIPHPLMHKRSFVLIPFAEIAPNIIHPKKRKSINQLLESIRKKIKTPKSHFRSFVFQCFLILFQYFFGTLFILFKHQ